MYSPPADTLATTLTTIKSPNYNAFVNDVAADLNLARPIVSGGTAATTAAGARRNLAGPYVVKSAGYTPVADDIGTTHRYTATATVSLTAAATLGSTWEYTVIADGGIVTIDPNGSETVNGAATLIVPNGSSAKIICDGSNFFAVFKPFVWEALGDFAPSAVSSFAMTNLSAYRKLRVTGFLYPSGSSVQIMLRTSTNNGSSYDSGASDYGVQFLGIQNATIGANSNSASFFGMGLADTGVNNGLQFTLEMEDFNVASYLKVLFRSGSVSGGNIRADINSGYRLQATARNAFSILPNSGTLTGRITVEGMRG